MKVNISETDDQLGRIAAKRAAEVLNQAIKKRGRGRIALSTGGSQFSFFKYFVQEQVDWEKVEMFHLDEYVDLPITHPASFRKYLKERFLDIVPVGKAHLVNVEGDLAENINVLSKAIQEAPIDLGVIGIGENAHIAFNDPPADFETTESYITVDLDDVCKMQQVGEGWFKTIEEVPKQAITMSVKQIMTCKEIISCVPFEVKAEALKQTLGNDVTNDIPATILKTHPNWHLYLDKDSSAKIELK